ncbi:cytochrome d ubiquinol oxidase subunit II [Blastococcus deserti]|uniref:Cytochrome d ubiquinol oxidase subunit II n=1 Tax=Blastococcus deserti TaxID=2259033 RepID=A0ABW4XB14_9ACTN
MRAVVTGAVGIAGLFVLRGDASLLFDGLTGRALPVVVLSVIAGLAGIVLVARRAYVPARLASGLAVAAILVGWGVAQYPYVLVPELTIEEAARGRATLTAMLIALLVGAVILLPALAYLYVFVPAGSSARSVAQVSTGAARAPSALSGVVPPWWPNDGVQGRS